MVRYVKDDELYHYRVGGEKNGVRRYQYPDGSLTPLGRIHYGVGPPRGETTMVEDAKRYIRAIRDTAAGYGLVKYKKTEEKVKGDRFAKARLAKQQKADEKRAKEAYEAKQKLKEEAKAKQEEFDAKLREAQQKNYEEAMKRFKERDEEIAKEKEEKQSRENVDEAKSKHWEDFSDEDLRNYTNRARLEAEATKARLEKLDAPRKIIAELASYGKTAVEAYQQYNQLKGIFKNFKSEKVPDSSEKIAKSALDIIAKNIGPNGDITKLSKEDLQKYIEIIGKVNKIENMAKPGGGNNNNNNNKNDKKN